MEAEIRSILHVECRLSELQRRTGRVSFAISLALPFKEMLSDWRRRGSAGPRLILPATQTPQYRCWQHDTVLITAAQLNLHVHLPTLPQTRDRVHTIIRLWK